MKKILAAMLFFCLLVASNCFAVEFMHIEVISDNRESEWRFSTDLLLWPQNYFPSYEVSFSVDGGPSQPMNYLLYGTMHVYDSDGIGTPLDYEGKMFSWNVTDESEFSPPPSEISATGMIPTGLARQVALSTDIAITGDPANPIVSWTNPEGNETGLILFYRLRLLLASDPTILLWESTIWNDPPVAQPVTCPILYTLLPGVEYLIRIEARQPFLFPITGNGFFPGFQTVCDEQTGECFPAAFFLNRSTVFVPYGIPIPIEIDIKPGSDPNSINLKSKGVVPVAVLTTDFFDAAMIEPDTVLFAGASAERWTICDVDDDGDQDMLFHFRTQDLDLDEDSTDTYLSCYSEGQLFEGRDSVRIVPAPKKK